MPRTDGVSKVTKMDKYVMHNMVEYIKTQPEFPFDALDVEESLEEVLGYFGFHPQFEDGERELVRKDLLGMALSAELAEMQHLVELGLTSGLERVRDTLYGRARFVGHPRSETPVQFVERMRRL